MYLITRLAWRNIWRNRRRTIITLASMVTAVVLAIVMRSMQLGSYEKMVENVVGAYTGHIQIQNPAYNDDKILDNTFASDSVFIGEVAHLSGVKLVLPRLESFALAAGRMQSRGALVVGLDPEGEKKFNELDKKVIRGSYLENRDDGILIAEELSLYLKCGVGDSVVIMGQGYHGASAAALYRVRGIVHFAAPELNKGFVCMTYANAQELFSTGSRLTSLVVEPAERKRGAAVVAHLKNSLSADAYRVLTWQELLPELLQQIGGDNAGGIVMLGILYMVVAFGIFGTVLMMTNERMREFGVVNALGLSAAKLSLMASVEIVFIALIGGVIGMLAALPVVAWFHAHPVELTGEAAKGMINYGIEPVMPFLLDAKLFAAHAGIVLVLSCVTALFPFAVLRKLNPVEAMRK